MNTDTTSAQAHVNITLVEFRVSIEDANFETRRQLDRGFTRIKVHQPNETELELTFARITSMTIDQPRKVGEFRHTDITVTGGVVVGGSE